MNTRHHRDRSNDVKDAADQGAADTALQGASGATQAEQEASEVTGTTGATGPTGPVEDAAMQGAGATGDTGPTDDTGKEDAAIQGAPIQDATVQGASTPTPPAPTPAPPAATPPAAPAVQKRQSKQNIIIDIMTANAGKPMSEVLQIMVDTPSLQVGSGVDLARARAYYTWISRDGLAPGKPEPRARKAKPAAREAARTVTLANLQAATAAMTPEQLAQAESDRVAAIKEITNKMRGGGNKGTQPEAPAEGAAQGA